MLWSGEFAGWFVGSFVRCTSPIVVSSAHMLGISAKCHRLLLEVNVKTFKVICFENDPPATAMQDVA